MQVLNSKSVGNKENSRHSPSKELQKLKIQLSDQVFENNKLQEDFAQLRAKLTIDFQKEKNTLNKNIKELKSKNQLDNDEWTAKIDQLRQQQIEALAHQTKSHEKQLENREKSIRKTIDDQYKS